MRCFVLQVYKAYYLFASMILSNIMDLLAKFIESSSSSSLFNDKNVYNTTGIIFDVIGNKALFILDNVPSKALTDVLTVEAKL